MEIIINSKRFDDWTMEDLNVLIDNPEYPENQLLDYKREFDFLRSDIDKNAKLKGKNSFKKDICSFANADGGILLIGIDEDSKTTVPKEILGIDIKTTTEKFERILFDALNGIVPAIPQIRIRFWKIKDQNYIVGIQIIKGALSPYAFEVDGSYYFKTRHERHNMSLSYKEIKEMYVNGIKLEEKISDFRNDRIDYFDLEMKDPKDINDLKNSRFVLLHIVPHDFFENENKTHRYILQRNKQFDHNAHFNGFCYGAARPSYDGLSYKGEEYDNGMQIKFFNNGIIELFFNLDKDNFISTTPNQRERLNFNKIINRMQELLTCYIKNQVSFSYSNKSFICASIIGCKNLLTESNFYTDYDGYIDDDLINCRLCEVIDVSIENYQSSFNVFKVDFLLSIGVKSID